MRNRLLQLLADNRKASARRFEARILPPRSAVAAGAAASSAPVEAEILLYDAIVDSALEAEYWGGVAPEPFVKALRALEADVIHLRINSPGGSVFAARAMETALREHKARVIVHVDGLAASAASFLAMAGDEVVMAKGAMLMIHKAWTFAWGNAEELNKTADLLEKIDGTLAQTYADRSGTTPAKVAAWMAAETWFTAQEAVDAKLADRISEGSEGSEGDKGAQAHAHSQAVAHAHGWNLSAYEHPPTPGAPQPAPAPAPGPGPVDKPDPAANEPRFASADHRHRQLQRLNVLQRTPIA